MRAQASSVATWPSREEARLRLWHLRVEGAGGTESNGSDTQHKENRAVGLKVGRDILGGEHSASSRSHHHCCQELTFDINL